MREKAISYSTYTVKTERRPFNYEIKERYGVLSSNGDYSKELNLIQYGNGAPKYDLRTFCRREGEEKLLKGLTMTADEVIKLRDTLNSIKIA